MTAVHDNGSRARKPKAAEIVAAAIRRDIITGDRPAGDHLPPESELMRQFGVSRPTLREAIRILEAESLVTMVRGTGGGPRVSRPDAAVTVSYAGYILQCKHTELEDVFEARAVIETAAVRELAEHANGVIPQRLAAVLASEASEIEKPEGFQRCASGFHDEIVFSRENQASWLMYRIVRDITDRQSRLAATTVHDRTRLVEHFARTHEIHAQTVRLISAGEATAAAQLWRRHMAATRRAMRTLNIKTAVDLYDWT
ncbi:MAG TPA: GntR family transcriptional regulator [Amycolatopsis sp.]|nr:GntR family transcriptional regulator [Amycolatopsis sp.]